MTRARKYTQVVPYYREEPVLAEDGGYTYDPYGNPIVTYTPTTNLPTIHEMRQRWCFGLPLTDGANIPISDEAIMGYLESSIREVERRVGIFLKPTIMTCLGNERGLVEGEDFDREEPPYDYDAKQWFSYGFTQLRQRPILEVHEYSLVLPNGQVVFDFMTKPEWLKTNSKSGQLRIVPYAGDPSIYNIAGSTLSGYPFLTGLIQAKIPQMIYVSYVAGYAPGKIPADISQIVAKIAAVDLLGVAGDAVLAGVSSLSTSIDGLSESLSTTASATSATYGAHIAQLKKEIDSFFSAKGTSIRTSERGMTFTIL